MLKVCPDCKALFAHASNCPRCGVGERSGRSRAASHAVQAGDTWQQRPGGRVIIGVLLALGSCYGLLQLCAASFVALGPSTRDGGFSPATRLALFLGLQGLALLAG